MPSQYPARPKQEDLLVVVTLSSTAAPERPSIPA
jgi:hypothetical protein